MMDDGRVETTEVKTKPLPWTTAQKIFSTTIATLASILFFYFHYKQNASTQNSIFWIDDSKNAVASMPIYLLTMFVYLLFTSVTILFELYYWIDDFQTVSDGVSVQSIPYQSFLGLVAVVYVICWIERMESTTIIDLQHCDLTTSNGNSIHVHRLRSPTFINWTAIESCTFGNFSGIGSEQDTIDAMAYIDTLDLKDKKMPSPTWYTTSDKNMRSSWIEHIVEYCCTLIFGSHLILIAALAIAEGLRGTHRKAFSYTAMFTTLNIIDIIVVFSTLSQFTDSHIYDIYGIAGCLRFLLLSHSTQCLEYFFERQKKKQQFCVLSKFLSILVTIDKLLFVVLLGAGLIFMAEKPCQAVLNDYRGNLGLCDSKFDTFTTVIYFTFVTLSTVGYGDMAPKTGLGRVLIILVILFGISYLPGAISDIISMHTSSEQKEDDDDHAVLKKMVLDLQVLREQSERRQVGFFHNGGTAEDRTRLERKASLGMLKLFIEKSKEDELRKQEMDEKKESETVEQKEIDGQLFLAGCNRLHTLHGEKKIEEALRIFGLDESGSAADLIEHVLGSTIAPFEIELEEEEQKSVVDEL